MATVGRRLPAQHSSLSGSQVRSCLLSLRRRHLRVPRVLISRLCARRAAPELCSLCFSSVRMPFVDYSSSSVAASSVLLLCLWIASVAVYRLLFHPLAAFPGPKLAAITTWYEGYYDVVKKGRFTFYLGAIHKKYGT